MKSLRGVPATRQHLSFRHEKGKKSPAEALFVTFSFQIVKR